MSKARLTYRLDAGRRNSNPNSTNQPDIIPLRQEEFKVIDNGQELNQFTNDFGAWKSPFDEETERIEKLIRESSGRMAAEQDNRTDRVTGHWEGPPPGTGTADRNAARQEAVAGAGTGYLDRGHVILDEEVDEPYYGDGHAQAPRQESARFEQPIVSTSTRYMRYSRTPWLKVGAAVAGAVGTGVLLGFLVLSLFNGGEASKVPESQVAEGTVPVEGTPEGGAASTATSTGGTDDELLTGGVQVQIPAKTYSILQNGGFSQEEGADTAMNDLLDKGLAGVKEQLDKHYVYAGIAADRTAASSLSLPLQNQQIEVYVKNYTLPAVNSIHWEGNTETLQTYLAQSDQLVQIISGMTAVHLEGAALTPMEENSLQTLKEKHEAWIATSAEVNSEAPDEIKPILQKLDSAMNTAKQSIDEYKRNPSAAMLWQAQTSLMQFVLAEKELLQKLDAN